MELTLGSAICEVLSESFQILRVICNYLIRFLSKVTFKMNESETTHDYAL